MSSVDYNIIFESIENPSVRYYTIESFIQFHRSLRLIQRINLSFLGAESLECPLKYVIVDDMKIPRYRIFLHQDKPVDLKELREFLDKKRAYWMISTISIYTNHGNPLITNRVEDVLKSSYEFLWTMAFSHINPTYNQSQPMPQPMPQYQPLPPSPLPALPPPQAPQGPAFMRLFNPVSS